VVELYLQCEQDSVPARARIDLIDQACRLGHAEPH